MLSRKHRLPSQSRRVQERNKALWNEHRFGHRPDFYTVGYAGRTIADICFALQQAEVATLVDIRHSAVSMYRPEFSKANLERHLLERGIHYLHAPWLGVPWDVRGEAVHDEDRTSIWEWYDSNVSQTFVRNLHFFFNAAEHPIALMCVELDPTECHRHRLCLALEGLGLRSLDL